MKLNAKARLAASNWEKDLADITDQKIVSLVKSLAAVVKINSVRTDGYNEDGNSGCEVHFEGKRSSISGGYEPGMSAADVAALNKIVNASGVETQLLASENELVLVFVAE